MMLVQTVQIAIRNISAHKRYTRLLGCIGSILVCQAVTAQQSLTLQNAIDTALLQNYSIQIVKNNTQIATANNSYGMAGGLPSVDASVGNTASLYDLHQELSAGGTVDRKGATSNVLSGGVSASMTLFNGWKITATKQRLDYLQQQSNVQLTMQIQNTIAAIMIQYYDIVRQQSYFDILSHSLDVCIQKLDIVQNRYNVGLANQADLLQSKMDCNMAKQQMHSQQLVIEQDKWSLLNLMGTKRLYDIAIHDSIHVGGDFGIDSIFHVLEHNPEYVNADMQVKISGELAREVQAQRYPSVRMNAGYSFSDGNYSAGTYLVNQSNGPFIGASVQIPIFNGSIYKTQHETALISVKNAELQKENTMMTLKTDVSKTYLAYQTSLQQLQDQQDNYKDAERLLFIVMERFKLGQATILDVKTAETTYENAGYLLVNLQYAAKVSEIELKRLMFDLR